MHGTTDNDAIYVRQTSRDQDFSQQALARFWEYGNESGADLHLSRGAAVIFAWGLRPAAGGRSASRVSVDGRRGRSARGRR